MITSNVEKKKVRVFIGLGSNLGDGEKNLRSAIDLLEKELGKAENCSSIIKTEPWGFKSENIFHNCVVEFFVSISPNKLLKITQEIEHTMGRKEKSINGYSDRVIDLDILYYGDLKVDSDELKIPHPEISKRLFVLDSLMEIDPNWLDVKTDKNIREMKRELSKY